MLRFLAIVVLVVLLPLQSSWSAIASYCEQETHVAHDCHDAQRGDPAADDALATDHGCDHCHCHGHATGLPAHAPTLPMAQALDLRPAATAAIAAAGPPERPERPRWARLA